MEEKSIDDIKQEMLRKEYFDVYYKKRNCEVSSGGKRYNNQRLL